MISKSQSCKSLGFGKMLRYLYIQGCFALFYATAVGHCLKQDVEIGACLAVSDKAAFHHVSVFQLGCDLYLKQRPKVLLAYMRNTSIDIAEVSCNLHLIGEQLGLFILTIST